MQVHHKATTSLTFTSRVKVVSSHHRSSTRTNTLRQVMALNCLPFSLATQPEWHRKHGPRVFLALAMLSHRFWEATPYRKETVFKMGVTAMCSLTCPQTTLRTSPSTTPMAKIISPTTSLGPKLPASWKSTLTLKVLMKTHTEPLQRCQFEQRRRRKRKRERAIARILLWMRTLL